MTDPRLSVSLKTMLGLDHFEAGDRASGTVIIAIAALSFVAAYFGFLGMAFLLALGWVFLISGGVGLVIPHLASVLASSHGEAAVDVPAGSRTSHVPPPLEDPAPPRAVDAGPAEILVLNENGDALETHIEVRGQGHEPREAIAAPVESESPRLSEVLASFRDGPAEDLPHPASRRRKGPGGAPGE